MKLLDARWTPDVNMLLVGCDCRRTFDHRADRWTIKCDCGAQANLSDLREAYHKLGQTSLPQPTQPRPPTRSSSPPPSPPHLP